MGSFVHSIGSTLGTNDNSGLNYQAQGADIAKPISSGDVQGANADVTSTLAQQAGFTNAVNGMAGNGIALQNQAGTQQQGLNAGLGNLNGAGALGSAMSTQAGLAAGLLGNNGIGNQAAVSRDMGQLGNQFAGQNGVGNQSSVFNQQQALANQFGNVAAGRGPNPAMAQLANQTGNNIQQQAALMAAQRGSGANAGLMARQAAEQGAGIQQSAVGQGAALQAQQQLAAMQGLQSQQQALGQTAAQQIQQRQTQQAAQAGLANTQIGQTQGANELAAGMANSAIGAQQTGINSMANQGANQVGEGQNAWNSQTGNQLAKQSNLIGGIGNQNNASVGSQGNVNSVNGGIQQIAAGQQGKNIGSLLSAAGKSAAGVAMAQGGAVPHYALGALPVAPITPINPVGDGIQSNVGKYLTGAAVAPAPMTPGQAPVAQGGDDSSNEGLSALGAKGGNSGMNGIMNLLQPGSSTPMGAADLPAGADMAVLAASKGGKVPAMVSPGEKYLSPKDVKRVEKGADPMSAGKTIPGKANVKGDSLKNDTVPKTLEEGGIVLPRSVTQSKNPHWAAHKFVSALMASGKLKG